MRVNEYQQIKTADGKEAICFSRSRGGSSISGLFADDRIWIHAIMSKKRGDAKRMITELVAHFTTNKITITPLITPAVEMRFRGETKICKAGSPDNPYGEDFKYLEMEWKS